MEEGSQRHDSVGLFMVPLDLQVGGPRPCLDIIQKKRNFYQCWGIYHKSSISAHSLVSTPS